MRNLREKLTNRQSQVAKRSNSIKFGSDRLGNFLQIFSGLYKKMEGHDYWAFFFQSKDIQRAAVIFAASGLHTCGAKYRVEDISHSGRLLFEPF